MNVNELAQELDIPVMTLYSLIQNGVIWSYTKTKDRRPRYIFNSKEVEAAVLVIGMLDLGIPRKLIAEVSKTLMSGKKFISNGIEIRRAK